MLRGASHGVDRVQAAAAWLSPDGLQIVSGQNRHQLANRTQYLAAGASGYATKPVDTAQLLAQ